MAVAGDPRSREARYTVRLGSMRLQVSEAPSDPLEELL